VPGPENTFSDPETGEVLGNPFDDQYAFTTDPGEVALRVERAGRAWAELEAAVDLLERLERNTTAALSRKVRGVVRTETDARRYAATHQDVTDLGDRIDRARAEARVAKVRYDTLLVWSRLIQTKWTTDRELAKIR